MSGSTTSRLREISSDPGYDLRDFYVRLRDVSLSASRSRWGGGFWQSARTEGVCVGGGKKDIRTLAHVMNTFPVHRTHPFSSNTSLKISFHHPALDCRHFSPWHCDKRRNFTLIILRTENQAWLTSILITLVCKA